MIGQAIRLFKGSLLRGGDSGPLKKRFLFSPWNLFIKSINAHGKQWLEVSVHVHAVFMWFPGPLSDAAGWQSTGPFGTDILMAAGCCVMITKPGTWYFSLLFLILHQQYRTDWRKCALHTLHRLYDSQMWLLLRGILYLVCRDCFPQCFRETYLTERMCASKYECSPLLVHSPNFHNSHG